jgi:fructokinase
MPPPEIRVSSTSTSRTVVGLGEVLWDITPQGRLAGGALLNFTYISSLLGERAIIASRVGVDALGRDMLAEISSRNLYTGSIQRDAKLPTGTAVVAIAKDGQPKFEITQPAAWDSLEFTDQWAELAREADAVCFGTLAQRSTASRASIRAFLKATRPDCLKVLDINLRAPFYSSELILESIRLANVVKCNEAEFPEILNLARGHSTPYLQASPDSLQLCLRKFDLQLICVTRGERGSLIASPQAVVGQPGLKVTVADTIGAGDAFTAALAHSLLSNYSLERTSMIANRWGAWVASQPGGMPPLTASAPRLHGDTRGPLPTTSC